MEVQEEIEITTKAMNYSFVAEWRLVEREFRKGRRKFAKEVAEKKFGHWVVEMVWKWFV